jgi:hypothetical protein
MAAALLEEGSFQNTGPCSIEAFFSRFEFDVDPDGSVFLGLSSGDTREGLCPGKVSVGRGRRDLGP